ncbi:MAG: 50S ribosomal protein L24 [Crenarchaeota archaeon]|nr:MAG: 50S ribosomal protein L24 [Thermoproteota archaeon]RDJ34111.1 MAG: 50S ribosomal protein L24 [Thermoproteota archaeon]RDJ36773.1 MAG: 50S ribosomal protein L24 [Thermoproteota archaeon]RDJ37693.1 MAG: 50S ribosomal protein L24 [Thermoproteota archaeon]
MKPTKMRNNQIYRASLTTRSNQLGSTLSKELRKKYGKRSVRIIEGDAVKVIRGEYKDVDGKVASVSVEQNSVAIEGIKKEKGQGDKFDVLIHTSNLMITSLNTSDSWRMSKLEGKKPQNVKKEMPKEVKEEAKKPEPKKEAPKEKKTDIEKKPTKKESKPAKKKEKSE